MLVAPSNGRSSLSDSDVRVKPRYFIIFAIDSNHCSWLSISSSTDNFNEFPISLNSFSSKIRLNSHHDHQDLL